MFTVSKTERNETFFAQMCYNILMLGDLVTVYW